MIGIFISSLDEYIADLDRERHNRNMEELKKTIHKMKPSILNLEVKGAAKELELLSKHDKWNDAVDASVARLGAILQNIRPLMQKDLQELPETDE